MMMLINFDRPHPSRCLESLSADEKTVRQLLSPPNGDGCYQDNRTSKQILSVPFSREELKEKSKEEVRSPVPFPPTCQQIHHHSRQTFTNCHHF